MKRSLAVLSLLATLVLTACGGGGSGGSSTSQSGKSGADAVKAAVLEYTTTNSCTIVTPRYLKELAAGATGATGCKIARTGTLRPSASAVNITNIKVTGPKATAQWSVDGVTAGGKPLVATLLLVKQGDKWLIDGQRS
jgi:hypothetical protein